MKKYLMAAALLAAMPAHVLSKNWDATLETR